MREAIRAFFGLTPEAPVATSVAVPAERQSVVDAVAGLTHDEFDHLATVCVDIARRAPGTSFDALGLAAQAHITASKASDVTVALSGVDAHSVVGGF